MIKVRHYKSTSLKLNEEHMLEPQAFHMGFHAPSQDAFPIVVLSVHQNSQLPILIRLLHTFALEVT